TRSSSTREVRGASPREGSGEMLSVMRSSSCTGFAQELADDRYLPCFFKQEAVMAVRCLDHLELDWLAQGAERVGDFSRCGGRVQPVGAERDQERPRGD